MYGAMQPTWREAVTECEAREFMRAESVLLKHLENSAGPPLAALATVLVIFDADKRDVESGEYEKGVGFSMRDKPEGCELGEIIRRGEPLTTERQAYLCNKLARRYALQAVKTVWGDGDSAAPERMQRLFDGRCPYSGMQLNWGDLPADAGDVDRGGSDDDDVEDEETQADRDFIDDAGADEEVEDEDEADEGEDDEDDDDEDEEASGEAAGAAAHPPAMSTRSKTQTVRAPVASAPASAPATVLASQAARDVLAARHDALAEACEAAQQHADALKKSLSGVKRQLKRAEQRAAADAEAAAQAARAAPKSPSLLHAVPERKPMKRQRCLFLDD